MIQIKNLKLSHNEQYLFEIDKLNINNNNQVIGLIGNNGVGKSSFAKVLASLNNEYEGILNNTFSTLYIEQSYFVNNDITLSGGEFVKNKIIEAFNSITELLILDEPSVYLDYDNRQFLLNNIKRFQGIIILISHDRDLIKQTTTEIFEIEDGKMNTYSMNYELYLVEKQNQEKNAELQLYKYKKTKNKLEKNILMRSNNSANSDKLPKRMGRSDAKLINSWNDQGRKSVDKNLKAAKAKLEKLEEVKPKYEFNKKIRFNYQEGFKSKKVIHLDQHDFTIFNKDRIAITGKNGIGKTTLLNSLLANENIVNNAYLSVGYLKQTMDTKYINYTVREFINEYSTENENEIRNYLSQFKYTDQSFYKKVKDLSQGEKLQLNLSILLSKKTNLLLLDEPTNYLDIRTILMLEEAIINYEGTVIFVTHDKSLIEKTNARVLNIK